MVLVELQNVSLFYKEAFSLLRREVKPAINDLSLRISEGENIGVLGGNGAGKSTLLKILAGIYTADSGHVSTSRPLRAVFIGLQSGFVPYLTGEQNIYLTGLLLGMSKSEIDNKYQTIVDYSELKESLRKPVFTYSAGMRARLAFSVSIHSEPDLLLLDEVMGVGDRSFKKKSNGTLREMIDGNTASVIVSHDTRYLSRVCSKAVWLENGRVRAYGAIEQVRAEYDGVQITGKVAS